jgi:hypothetical protein
MFSRPRAVRAAGLLLGVARDGQGDGRSVPVRHLRAGDEMRIAGQGIEDLRHHPARLAVLPVLLEQDAQEGERSLVGTGKDVVGVQVAKIGEDPQELRVELRVCHLREPVPQQAQPLGRIDPVHGALLQQVHVQAVDHGLRLIGDGLAVGLGYRTAVEDGPEVRQRVHCSEIVVRREPEFWNGRQ